MVEIKSGLDVYASYSSWLRGGAWLDLPPAGGQHRDWR